MFNMLAQLILAIVPEEKLGTEQPKGQSSILNIVEIVPLLDENSVPGPSFFFEICMRPPLWRTE
jgi:hypothetical protein